MTNPMDLAQENIGFTGREVQSLCEKIRASF